MDGFDHEYKNSSNTAYAYVQPSDVQNYWTLATRFTLADEVMQMNMGPSFAAHVNLVAAQGGYPYAFAGNPTTKSGAPGCFGTMQVPYIDMRLSYPGLPLTTGPACMDMQTIFDLLDGAGIGWKYYAPDYAIGANLWSAPNYITHIANGPDYANLVHPESQILNDIAASSLPPVPYVVPQMCASDHPHGAYVDPLAGPHWVAAITNAIGASPYWDDTLVLVTWDDWGGWYDHVKPAVLNDDQVSFRTPLLVVSAYPAAPGTPDHTARYQASIITAIESNFGLGNLGQLDAQTDDLSGDFNFSQPPVGYGSALPSQVPPVKCKIKGADPVDD
jgi:phospholipase C